MVYGDQCVYRVHEFISGKEDFVVVNEAYTTVNDQFVRTREKIEKMRRKIETYVNIFGRLLNTIHDIIIVDLNN